MSDIEQTPFTFNEFTENPEPSCACLLRRSYAEPLALLLVCLKFTMPVGLGSTMTHPRRSMGIAPLRRYYEAVRPSPAHRYFQPHGWSRLCFFPWHRRPGSHVPYRSLVELRAAYTPDAARSVSGHPPS